MGDSKRQPRLSDMRQSHFWKEYVEREERIRLRWFMTHRKHFISDSDGPLANKVPDGVKEEMGKNRENYHLNKDYFPGKKAPETEFPVIDPMSINRIMRPVDHDTEQIIYSDGHENRINYLKERVKLIPEKRYYFPETTSFRYGWNMWECAKAKPNYGHGRCQIIQQSFYRRRGVDKDPDWYKQPEKLSPTVCGCL